MRQKLDKIPPNCLHINYALDKEYLEEVAYTLPRKEFYFKGKKIHGYHYAPWSNALLEGEFGAMFGIKGRFNMKFIFLEYDKVCSSYEILKILVFIVSCYEIKK